MVFLCGRREITGLFSPPPPLKVSLPRSAIRALYPNKTSLAKLLIACNEIFIDRCGDQSLYLRAALLELPVTGGFRRALSAPAPGIFTALQGLSRSGAGAGEDRGQVGRRRGFCPHQPAVPPTKPVEGTRGAQEALVASRELSILPGIPVGSHLRQPPQRRAQDVWETLPVLFGAVQELGSVSLDSGYSSIP